MVDSNLTAVYWLSRYIKEELNQSGLSSETLSTYTSRCRIFRMWIESKNYSHLDITAIDNPKIIEFFTYLRNERHIAKRTYNSYIEILIAFFEFIKKPPKRRLSVYETKNQKPNDIRCQTVFFSFFVYIYKRRNYSENCQPPKVSIGGKCYNNGVDCTD
jgi:site-specific recombinase XerD